QHLSRPDIVAVLDADPELSDRLPGEELDAARRALIARVVTVEPGLWQPDRHWDLADHPALGLLVLDGLLTREVTVAARPSTELIGSGDLLRPWDQDGDLGMMPLTATWSAVSRTRLAVLDQRFLLAACRWPAIMDEIGSRMLRRSRWLAFLLAMKQIMRVESR